MAQPQQTGSRWRDLGATPHQERVSPPRWSEPPVDARPLAGAAARRGWAIVWLALAAIVLLGLALRLPPYLSDAIYIDEANTWESMSRPSLQEFLYWQHHKEHPPLSYLIVRGLTMVVGSEALPVLRLPSLICGLLVLPAAFVVGRQVAGAGVGLLAAALAAVDPNMVQQSGFARMYTLAMLLALLTIAWLGHLGARREADPWSWVLLGLLLAANLWSSSLGLVVVGACGVWLMGVAAWRWRAGGRAAALSLLSGGALAAVIAATATHIGLLKRLARGQVDYEWVNRDAGDIFSKVSDAVGALLGVGPAWPALAAAAGLGLAWVARRRPATATLIATVAVTNAVAMAVLLRGFHHAGPRHFTLVSPAVWVGLAALALAAPAALGAWRRATRLTGGGVVAVALALGMWHSTHLHDWKVDAHWMEVADRVREARASGAADAPVAYFPAHTELVGRYLGVPGDPTLQPWLVARSRRLAEPPPDVSLDRVTVIVVNDGRPGVDAVVRDLAAMLAAPLDEAELQRRLADGGVDVFTLARPTP